jgi:hypothetical protein
VPRCSAGLRTPSAPRYRDRYTGQNRRCPKGLKAAWLAMTGVGIVPKASRGRIASEGTTHDLRINRHLRNRPKRRHFRCLTSHRFRRGLESPHSGGSGKTRPGRYHSAPARSSARGRAASPPPIGCPVETAVPAAFRPRDAPRAGAIGRHAPRLRALGISVGDGELVLRSTPHEPRASYPQYYSSRFQ